MELCTVRCLLLCALAAVVRGAYVFPPVFIQARESGGIKAYLPDSCGVDGFSFQIKRVNETAWKTGNGTKEEKFWTFWDRGRTAKIGDVFDFAARVWYRGSPFTFPASKWTVPAIMNEFEDPAYSDTDDNCIPTTEPTKPVPKALKKELRAPKIIKEEGGEKEEETEQKKPTVPSRLCTLIEPPKPGSTKEEVLEKQLAMLQCEMSAVLERSSRLSSELNKELLDLKKLNYAAVARMQRLESLIRTIPRAIPFPYV